MLVNKDRVSVRVNCDKTGGARRGLVGLAYELHAFRPQLALKITHVGKGVDRASVAPLEVNR